MKISSTIFFLVYIITSCSKIDCGDYQAPTIQISTSDEGLFKLQQKRAFALKCGVLQSTKEDFIQSQLIFKNDTHRIKLRLKGDWTDHIEGEHWSFRVHSKKAFFKMKRFNLHYPSTKGYSYDWLFYQACRHEGIITPSINFQWLVFNNDTSLYQIEEQIGFGVLRNNNVIPSPIIKFDESMAWKKTCEWVKWDNNQDSIYFFEAPVDGFRTKKINQDSILTTSYNLAKSNINDFRNGKKKTSEVFNIKRLSKYFALSDLFGGAHAIRWHNMRFYFDSTTQKLEPIAYDASCGNINQKFNFDCSKKRLNSFFIKLFFDDAEFYKMYINECTRLMKFNYVDNLLNKTYCKHKKIIDLLKIEYPKYEFSSDFLYDNVMRFHSSL